MRLRFIASFAIAAGLLAAAPAALAADDTAAAPPAPARVVESYHGPIFVTPEGKTLYFSGGDRNGKSSCTGTPSTKINDPTAGFGTYNLPGYRLIKSCVDASPPFLAPADAKPHGDWTLFDRPEGTKQWVFRGRPLYTSTRDMKPGDRNGGAQGQGGRGGMTLATAPVNLPAGLDFIRFGEQVVLADSNRRPLYTPRSARLQRVCVGCGDLFKPLAAPALTKVSGEWSVVASDTGSPQYAYRGKPLYLQPEGSNFRDIEEAGEWEMIVLHKSPGTPSAIATRYNGVLGDIYTAKDGRTLYMYTCTAPGCDQPGGPAGFLVALCGEPKECSRRWRPYVAAPGSKPVGEWSIVEVTDPLFTDPMGTLYPPDLPKVKAWAYQGRPVFLFHEDQAPGDIWGHNMRWFSFANFVALQLPSRQVVY